MNAAKTVDIETRLHRWHESLREDHDSLERIAIVLYDPETDSLSTFLSSSKGKNALSLYSAKLSEVPSLQALAESGEPRIVNNLADLAGANSTHSQRLQAAGLKSSYTAAFYDQDALCGFIFFNSSEEEFFNAWVASQLEIYCELMSAVVCQELQPIQTLRAAVNLAFAITKQRDMRMGEHAGRMSHYVRMIAQRLAPNHDLSDQYIQFLFQLSGLHDLGTISLPDSILLKAGELTSEEFELMKFHVPKGIELVDTLMKEFRLESVSYAQMLRNIIAYHHENYDGSGYPWKLCGDKIPLEARIARVADAYDALTSYRRHKKVLQPAEALDELRQNAGIMFDPECVGALAAALAEE